MEERELLKILEKVATGCIYIGGEWDKATDSCKKGDVIIKTSKGVEGGVDIEIRKNGSTLFIEDLKSPDAIIKEEKDGERFLKFELLGEDFDTIITIPEYGNVFVDIGKELDLE